MNRYRVDYIDCNDDLCHVTVFGDTKHDAITEVYHEYWDVKEVINVIDD